MANNKVPTHTYIKIPKAESLTPGHRVFPYEASLSRRSITRYKLQYKRDGKWYDMWAKGELMTFDNPYTAKHALDVILGNKLPAKPKPPEFPFSG